MLLSASVCFPFVVYPVRVFSTGAAPRQGCPQRGSKKNFSCFAIPHIKNFLNLALIMNLIFCRGKNFFRLDGVSRRCYFCAGYTDKGKALERSMKAKEWRGEKTSPGSRLPCKTCLYVTSRTSQFFFCRNGRVGQGCPQRGSEKKFFRHALPSEKIFFCLDARARLRRTMA